jgi:hypothetical protein
MLLMVLRLGGCTTDEVTSTRDLAVSNRGEVLRKVFRRSLLAGERLPDPSEDTGLLPTWC